MKRMICLVLSFLFLSVFPIIGYAANPQVADYADLFTEEEEQELSQQIEILKENYGKDLVIYTDTSSYGDSHGMCAADYYTYYGYGMGEDSTGSILFICMEPGNRGWFTAAAGECRELYTEKVINQIDDRIESSMVEGDYFEAMNLYLDCVDELYRKGKISRSWDDYKDALMASLLPALILAAIPVGIGAFMMKTVNTAVHAKEYLVKDSFQLHKSKDTFLFSNVNRVRKEEKDSSERSSYSGSYSSSGGKEFSGGGRKF